MQSRVVAGRYRLVRQLGRGGMGIVWLAEDELVGRQVAVKELRPPHGLTDADRETFGRRALQEARSAGRVRHPGAVALYDILPATAADDATYLVMELIEGPTLAELVQRDGRLPEVAVAGYGLQLLSVLEAAHALGVVHRDIKPGNVMIAAEDQARLTDFGIAHTLGDTRLTRSGTMGSPAYMAPELFESASITPAADLWSLGATLYYAAEGCGPFDRDSTAAILRAILIGDLPVPRCAPALAAAITGMLQRDPADRATIDRARDGLQAAAQPAPVVSSVAPAVPIQPTPTPPQPPEPADSIPVPAPPGGLAAEPSKPTAQWAGTKPQSPPTVRPPHPEPQAGPHRRRRRGLVVVTIVAAPVLVTAAVAVPLLTGQNPAPVASPRHPAITSYAAVTPTLTATLPDSGGSNSNVNSVAFSPDGKTLAVGDDDDSTYLWDVANRKLVATLRDPNGLAVDSIAFSPGGQTLAAGDEDGHTFLWDLASRSIVATLTDFSNGGGSVASVAFSPGGQILATGDREGYAFLFEVATGKLVATLRGPAYSVLLPVAFSPDGQMLAAGFDQGSIYLWDVATGKLVASLPVPAGSGGTERYVNSVAFSPDGKTLAAGDEDGNAYLWDVATGKLVATLPDPYGYSARSVAFSPDGHVLAVGNADDSTYLWDVATDRVVATLPDPVAAVGESGWVDSVAFSPDGRNLAVGDYDDYTYLWHI